MPVVGKFLIKESFTLTNVGFTIVGEIIEGKVYRGNQLTINSGAEMITLTIRHIDLPSRPTEGNSPIGLRFTEEYDHNDDPLAGLKIPQQLVEVVGEIQ